MFASQPMNRGSSSEIRQKLQLPKKLAIESKVQSTDSHVYKLELPADIQPVLSDFKKRLKSHSRFIPRTFNFRVGQAHSLAEMEQQFKALEEMLSLIEDIAKEDKTSKDAFFKKGEKDKLHLAIEQYKLCILEATLADIKKRYHLGKTENEEKAKESQSLIKAVYYGVAVGSGLVAVADGIIAANTIFAGVAATIMFPMVVLTAWINLRLYRAVELSSLKEEFGLDDGESIDKLMQTKQKQVDVTAKINSCILSNDVAMMKEGRFLGFAKLAKAAHASVKNQNEKSHEYQETPPKFIGRWALAGCGAAIMGAFGYFSIQEAVIGLLALGAAFTPPGWVMLGVSLFAAACTAVAYLYAVQGMGLYNMFNPQAAEVKKVKKSYHSYEIEHEKFDANLTAKMEHTIEQQFMVVNEEYKSLHLQIDLYLEKQGKMVIEEEDINQIELKLSKLEDQFVKFDEAINALGRDDFRACFEDRDALYSNICQLHQMKDQLKVTDEIELTESAYRPTRLFDKSSRHLGMTASTLASTTTQSIDPIEKSVTRSLVQ